MREIGRAVPTATNTSTTLVMGKTTKKARPVLGAQPTPLGITLLGYVEVVVESNSMDYFLVLILRMILLHSIRLSTTLQTLIYIIH